MGCQKAAHFQLSTHKVNHLRTSPGVFRIVIDGKVDSINSSIKCHWCNVFLNREEGYHLQKHGGTKSLQPGVQCHFCFSNLERTSVNSDLRLSVKSTNSERVTGNLKPVSYPGWLRYAMLIHSRERRRWRRTQAPRRCGGRYRAVGLEGR